MGMWDDKTVSPGANGAALSQARADIPARTHSSFLNLRSGTADHGSAHGPALPLTNPWPEPDTCRLYLLTTGSGGRMHSLCVIADRCCPPSSAEPAMTARRDIRAVPADPGRYERRRRVHQRHPPVRHQRLLRHQPRLLQRQLLQRCVSWFQYPNEHNVAWKGGHSFVLVSGRGPSVHRESACMTASGSAREACRHVRCHLQARRPRAR